MPRKPKRSQAQQEADARYAETNRIKNRANQAAKYANLAATFLKEEKTRIQKTFKKNGMTVANALRIVEAMLNRGDPLPSIETPKAEADGENADTDEPPTT